MSLFGIIVGLHAAGGSLALLAGPIPMIAAKGLRLHRRAGLVYAAAMLVTAVSGLCLAIMVNDVLLLVIAVFSFFLVFTGAASPWPSVSFGCCATRIRNGCSCI